MSGQALLDRYDIFFTSGVLAAEATSPEGGFRQRDVKFYVELFMNYVAFSNSRVEVPIQNVHILRFLTQFVSSGYCRKVGKNGPPRYELTRGGIFEALRRLVSKSYFENPAHFFFVFSFIENYAFRVKTLVEREADHFPYAMQLEIRELLDLEHLANRQKEFLLHERKGLKKRIDDQVGTRDVTQQLLSEGKTLEEILAVVEKKFPYSMHTKKPMSEFYFVGTPRQAMWELLEGGIRRNQQQYYPSLERIDLQIAQIDKVVEDSRKRREAFERERAKYSDLKM